MSIVIFIAVLGLSALLIFALAGLRIVPESRVFTVHRHGHYRRTLRPGLNWIVPGLDHVAHRVALIGHRVALPAVPLAPDARAELYWQILDPERAGAALDDIDRWLRHEAEVALGELAADPGESALGEALKRAVNRRVDTAGLRVIRCAIHAGR